MNKGQEPRLSIVLVIIFWVVNPLLVLCYLVYAIRLFANNPTNASYEANLHVLWTFIKAVPLLIIGYFLLAVPGLELNARTDRIKKWQEQEEERAERSRMEQGRKAAFEEDERRADRQKRFLDARHRADLERVSHVEQLRKELAELKGTTFLSNADDPEFEEPEA